jgi:putative resolvase
MGISEKKIAGQLPVAVYCRVSSHEQKQKGDLDRQKARLLEYCVKKKYSVEQIFDEVGSGMNDSRSKLHKLLQLVFERKISRVIIEHKDRLSRFNFNIFKVFFESYGVAIEYVEETLPKAFEDELVEDMLSLMASFSAKIYGKRSAENRKKNCRDATKEKL